MGFYYCATMAFGLVIPEDEVPDCLKKFDSFYEGEDFDTWFYENNPWNVRYEYVFNEGGSYLLFYNDDCYDSGEAREENGLVSLREPSKEERESFDYLAVLFDVSKEKIGWHHIWSAN